MFMENVLSSPLENAEAEKIQTCSRPHHGGGGLESHDVSGANVTSGSLHQSTLLLEGHHRQGQEARDYTDYLNFLAVFIWTTFAVFAFLFKVNSDFKIPLQKMKQRHWAVHFGHFRTVAIIFLPLPSINFVREGHVWTVVSFSIFPIC